MQSDTGAGDSSSPWGTGLLSTIGNLAGTAGNLYQQFTGGSPAQPAPAPKPAPAAKPASSGSSWTKYLPWIGGGIVLLVIVGFLFKRK